MSSGVVSATDHFESLRLGAVGMLALEVLQRRALDQELAERPRSIEQLERTKPEPQWVTDVRKRIGTGGQNPTVCEPAEVESY